MKRNLSLILIILLAICAVTGCSESQTAQTQNFDYEQNAQTGENVSSEPIVETAAQSVGKTPDEEPISETAIDDGFIVIEGGSFQMGSPETEEWQSADETLHEVTVSNFYMSPYNITQNEYQAVMGENPGNFSGENLPAENMTWLEAIEFCNGLSESQGLEPAYEINGNSVSR